jgi:hypothetical protein
MSRRGFGHPFCGHSSAFDRSSHRGPTHLSVVRPGARVEWRSCIVSIDFSSLCVETGMVVMGSWISSS